MTSRTPTRNGKRRSKAEAAFWDAVFLARFPECMRESKKREPEYCAHLAQEQADAALAARRRSQEMA